MPPLPAWLRKPETHFESLHDAQADLRRLDLHTVCESARCPNIHECFHRGAATFMILGNVLHPRLRVLRGAEGHPAAARSRGAGKRGAHGPALQLRYVVITSVNRDDLADGGVRALRPHRRAMRGGAAGGPRRSADAGFSGRPGRGRRVLDAGPHVFNHNLETVARLYPRAPAGRLPPLAGRAAAGREALAASRDQVRADGRARRERARWSALLGDLREAGVDVVTIGQYLQPTRRNLPVASYRAAGAVRGVARRTVCRSDSATCSSGPLVRSSYMAEDGARGGSCAELGSGARHRRSC